MQATKRTFRRATLMAAAFAVTVGVAARADEHRFTATNSVCMRRPALSSG